MTIRTINTFPFETEFLLGEIRCDVPKPTISYKPGVIYLAHKAEPRPPHKPGYDLLPEVPRQALLMPEWLKTENRSDGIFWNPCHAQADSFLDLETVVFKVDAGQTLDWDLAVEFRYTPGPDWIDLEMRLLPNRAHEGFDFFFASYIVEDMESTWVPALIDGKEEWRKLDNRKTEPWGRMYGVPRDDTYRQMMFDGRYAGVEEDRGGIEDYCYSRPIIVCHKQETGLACVTLIEPEKNRVLCGQKHQHETAHDFTFSGDLAPGELFTGKARLVVRNIGSFPDAVHELNKMWDEFHKQLSTGREVL